ncbi:hypothetical protein ACTFIY_004082 [Dictyostelium cf. discoideum]
MPIDRQSYSIPTTKLKKLEIVEKIKAVVKRKREYEKNKIKKNIFSFMDQQFSLSYDSISSIPNLIISNKFGISKEKVYRNYYRFYRNFFKKENHYYEFQDNISFALILSKNLQIYKLYIKEFNYKPTKVDLLFSIISGSNKFIKYLFELNPPPPISELNSKCLINKIFTNIFLDGGQDQINRTRKEAFHSIKKDSIFKGLLCFLNIINNNDDGDKFSCSLNYNELLYDKTENDLYEINQNSTLKRLIATCIFLLKTKTTSSDEEEEEEDEDDEDKDETTTSKESFKSVPAIQEIEIFKEKVGKERLKSILQDPINYNYKRDDNNEIKNFIKKLLYFYFSTFKKTSSILYYCYFDEKDHDDDITATPTNFILPQPRIEFAFRFGNFKILESFKTIDFYQILPNIRFKTYSESNDDDDSTDECYKI